PHRRGRVALGIELPAVPAGRRRHSLPVGVARARRHGEGRGLVAALVGSGLGGAGSAVPGVRRVLQSCLRRGWNHVLRRIARAGPVRRRRRESRRARSGASVGEARRRSASPCAAFRADATRREAGDRAAPTAQDRRGAMKHALPSLEPAGVADVLVLLLRTEKSKIGFARGVVGVSGGLDSAVSAALAAKALGPNHMLGWMMPYRTSSESSERLGKLLCSTLGMKHERVDLTPIVDGYLEHAGVAVCAPAAPLRR